MSRRMKFQSQAQLNAAYARLADQGWVDSCTIDVPGLELHVQVACGRGPQKRAEAWLALERGRSRHGPPARD